MSSLSIRRPVARGLPLCQPVPLLLLLLSLLCLVQAQQVSSPSAESTPGTYFYNYFLSGPGVVVDGPNATGVFCRPGAQGVALNRDVVVFSDMCSPGSAIRRVNTTAIATLAGSLDGFGYVDGTAREARFGALPTGLQFANGITFSDGNFYLADSTNNVIRRITTDGQTSTFISTSVRFDGKPLKYPAGVVSYVSSNGQNTLFIGDVSNQRILATPVAPAQPLLTLLVSGFQPNLMVISQSQRLMFFTSSLIPIGVMQLEEGRTWWQLGRVDCVGYINALMLSTDESEVQYYGSVNNVRGIYSFPTSLTSAQAATACPTLRYAWPFADSIISLIRRDETSLYAVTLKNVYVLSQNNIPWPPQPEPGPASSSSAAESSSGSGSSSSSSEESLSSMSGSSSGSEESSSTSSSGNGRSRAVAAFPMNALPTSDDCLMSQLYYWIRYDVAIAFNTRDYYTQFMPLNDPAMAIYGDVNVSSWCGRIHSRTSLDGTVEIVDFDGPASLSANATQAALDNSPWYYTRLFLDSLRGRGIPLSPFCYFNCGTQCDTFSANDHACPVPVNTKAKCGGLCKGAIASSVTLGVTGIACVVIAILSPAALLSGLVLVPLI